MHAIATFSILHSIDSGFVLDIADLIEVAFIVHSRGLSEGIMTEKMLDIFHSINCDWADIALIREFFKLIPERKNVMNFAALEE